MSLFPILMPISILNSFIHIYALWISLTNADILSVHTEFQCPVAFTVAGNGKEWMKSSGQKLLQIQYLFFLQLILDTGNFTKISCLFILNSI